MGDAFVAGLSVMVGSGTALDIAQPIIQAEQTPEISTASEPNPFDYDSAALLRRSHDASLRFAAAKLGARFGLAGAVASAAVRATPSPAVDGPGGGGNSIPPEKIKVLSRGGVMVQTSAGWIQIGVPMWTNKDAFARFVAEGGFGKRKEEIPHIIPTTYIFDPDYNPDSGLLPADFLQYMFFVTQGTTFTLVVPDVATRERLKQFLDLSYLGPMDASLTEEVQKEYPDGAKGIPDMHAEITRGFPAPPTESLRQVTTFDSQGTYSVGNVTIRRIEPMVYEVIDQAQSLGRIDLKQYPIPPRRDTRELSAATNSDLLKRREEVLYYGKPALWPIGTGHGFSPKEETSGFMIWNNGRCALVDPPSSTIEYFLANGLPLEAIEGVILSHGHTDHYGNAIPRLLRALPRIRIHATTTIFKMLQQEYELAMGGDGVEGPVQWNFSPVTPQQFTQINGMWFRFDYSFHVVPTIGFEIWTKPSEKEGNLVTLFTGDTFADYAAVWSKTEKGPNEEEPVMTRERAWEVMRHMTLLLTRGKQNPPPVFLVEGGIAPIHIDPVKTRELLEMAERMGADISGVRIYHIAKEAAEKAGVPKWVAGHEGVVNLSKFYGGDQGYASSDETAERIFRVLDRIPLLDSLTQGQKMALTDARTLQQVDANTNLMNEGEVGDNVFLLLDGEVEVTRGGSQLAVRPAGIFGEGALLGEPRNATVSTTVPSTITTISAERMKDIVGPDFVTYLANIRRVRSQTFTAVRESPLGKLPETILDLLFGIGSVENYGDGFALIGEGDTSKDVFVIVSGNVHITNRGGSVDVRLGSGNLLGEMALALNAPRSATVNADHDVTVLRLPADKLQELMDRYPGIGIALRRTAEKRKR